MRNGYWKSRRQAARAARARRPSCRRRVIARLRPAGSSASTRVVRQRRRQAALRLTTRAIEHRDAVGDAAHLLEIVRHHQHRRAPPVLQRPQQLFELLRRRLRRGRWPARRESAARASDRARCASSTRRSSPPESTDERPPLEARAGRRRASSAAMRVRVAALTPKQTGRRCRVSARKSSTVTGRRGIDGETSAARSRSRPSRAPVQRRCVRRTGSGPSSATSSVRLARAVGTDDDVDAAAPDLQRDVRRAAHSPLAGDRRRRRTRRAAAARSSLRDQRPHHRLDVALHLALELVGA